MSLARALHERLCKKKESIVFAESCTGGNLTAKLTRFPGASAYLLGGFTLYSNELKCSILGVNAATIEKYGAVSQEVVTEMVQGIFNKTNAIWGVSVSGIAGPDGGTRDKPVGTIYIAIGKRGEKIDARLIPLEPGGDRESNIDKASDYIFSLLYEKLS